jgi:hypothetical protein
LREQSGNACNWRTGEVTPKTSRLRKINVGKVQRAGSGG